MAAYDDIAEWYDATLRAGSLSGDAGIVPLLELIGDISGLKVCDLACGQGRLSRELAQHGATVVGVDIASKLIAIAQKDEAAEPLGISYLVDDAQSLSRLEEATFDGVACHLALMDIPDLKAVFQAVQRILKPGGWFAFLITHPCFQPPHANWVQAADGKVVREVGSYFEEGFWRSNNPNGVRGQVGAYHRRLDTYLNTLTQTGFTLECLIEPEMPEKVVAQVPGYAIVPPFLAVRCHKN